MIQKDLFKVLILCIIIKLIYSSQENRIAADVSTQAIDTSTWPIFKTYSAYSTDSLEYCEFYQNADVFYFKYDSKEYFALSLIACGFNVFSVQNPSNPKLEVNFPIKSGRINKFSFDVLRNILWIAHSEGKIFYIKVESIPFKVEQAFVTNNSIKSFFISFIPKVQNAILVVCFNEIQIFSNDISNFQDVSSLTYQKSITLNNSNDIIKIVFINNLLLVGSVIQGVQFYQISQIQSLDFTLTLIKNISPNNIAMTDFQITSKNIIYINLTKGGLYSYNANDCITKGDANSCKTILQIDVRTRPQKGGDMFITRDEKYLITQYSSYGIQIFDISSTKLKSFQIIDSAEEAVSLDMNQSETLIFQTGSSKLQIYQRNNSNIQLDKPNILLQIIQNTDQTFYKEASVTLPELDCYIDSKKNYVYLSRYSNGLTIFKKQPQGILKTVIKFEETIKTQAYGKLKFFLDSTIAYATKGANGLGIIDFTNPEKPVYIKDKIKFGIAATQFFYIECSSTYSMCSILSHQTGAVFINIQNLQDPQLIKIFSYSNNNDLNYYAVSFMRSQKVAFLAADQFGVYVVDLNDSNLGQQISSLYLNDGTSVQTTQDDKYLIAASSYKGISIIDISNLKQLKIISKVQLFGKPSRIFFMSNEKYIVIISQEKPAVFLIDIQDKFNPILLQTLKRKTTENLLSICFDPDESEGFITSAKPFIQTNFKNQVIFQKVVYQLISISGSNEKKYFDIEPQSPLQVGQIYNIRIYPLYIDNVVSIKKAMIYENYILQPLKSWMTFQSEYNLLQVTAVKDALSQNQNGKFISTSQQIIFQSHIALDTSSFINSYLNIDLALSTKILAECQKLGYVDELNMVSEYFNYQSQVQISFEKIVDASFLATLTDEKKDDMIKAIKYVFKHSIVYYPIEIIVSPSLSFDQTNSENKQIISQQDEVSFLIRISQGQGKFVHKDYPGIICIVSSQQDEIKIEGELKKVNEVLTKKIKFSSYSPKENIIFTIKIQDGINYEIEQKISYSDALFISEQSEVKLKKDQSIQSDFSSKFDESSIYIRERFIYQIPSELFDCEENQQLYFSALKKDSDGEYSEIPVGHWISFSSTDRSFSGQPSEKELFKKIELRIKISDKYSFIITDLSINVSKIPFIFIFSIFAQIIGPLLALLGAWKYKYMVYNAIQKKSYTYSKELIYTGKQYQKQILLNNWNIEIANQILDQFKKIVSNKEIIQQIYEFQSSIVQQQNNSTRTFIQKFNNENSHQDTVQNSHQDTVQNSSQDTVQNSLNQQTCLGTEVKDEVIESHIDTPNLENSSSALQQNNRLKQRSFQFNKPESPKVNIFSEEKLIQQPQINNIELKTLDSNVLKINNDQQQQKLSQNLDSCQNQQSTHLDMNNQAKQSEPNLKRRITVESFNDFSNQIRTRKFSKQFKQQVDKISKSRFDQNLAEKSISRIDCLYKRKSVDKGELWLFDQQGNINYNKVIQILISNIKTQKNNSNILTEEVIQHLNNQNSLLRQTFECFLAEFILQKDTFSFNIYKELYTKSQQPLGNPQWYKSYCTIIANVEDIHRNPVPIVTFNNSAIEFEIKSLLFGQSQLDQDLNMLEKIPFSLYLIKETIKGYALGFTSNSVKIKPLSSGESIHIESYNIKQITSYCQKIDNLLQSIRENLKYSCKQKSNKEFIEKPLVDNYKLPPWIKSVEIINNNLLIVGCPENKDIGRVYLFIQSKLNYIVRAFEIEVIDKEVENTQNNQQNNIGMNDDQRIQCENILQRRYQSQFEQAKTKQTMNIMISERQQVYYDSVFDAEEEIKQPHQNQFTM